MKNNNKPRPKKKAKTQPTARPELAVVATPHSGQPANDKQAHHQPHDKFVKCAFKNKEIATDFFNAHLTDRGLSKQELGEFSLSNNEHQQPFRSKLVNDIVYRGEVENQSYYIVLEHQSSFDKTIVVRFLQYSAALINEHVGQNGDGIPVILGICLYHNTHGNHTPGSNHKTNLESYFLDGKEGRHACCSQLKYEIKLVDLTAPEMDCARMASHGHAAILELFLKDAHLSGDAFISQAKAHLASKSYQNMSTEKFGEFKLSLYEYILSLGERPPAELINTLVEVVPAEKEIMLTAAEQLRQEGRLEGRQEGRHERDVEIITNLKSKGHSPRVIQDLLQLSEEELERLSPSSAESLSSPQRVGFGASPEMLGQCMFSASAIESVSGTHNRANDDNTNMGLISTIDKGSK